MVSAGILALHVLIALGIFVSRRKKGGLTEGLLGIGLFGILFSVGWTLCTSLTRLVVSPEGFGRWMDRDTVTLTVLTIIEGIIYGFVRSSKRDSRGDNAT